MRIAIDLTSLSYHLSGIERYALCMTEKMLELDGINEYVLIFRDEIFPAFISKIDNKRVCAKILRGNNKLLFFQITLPLELYAIPANKYIFFAFTSPVLFKRPGIVNTIHDMGPWDCVGTLKPMMKAYYRISMRRAAKVAEKIITVSEFSKSRIMDILHAPEDKIQVIYSGVYEGITDGAEAPFDEVKALYGLPDKYVMTLSTLEPRKNMRLLIEAFSEVADKVDFDVALVGRKGWKLDEVLGNRNLSDRIHITGFVDERRLKTLYKNALCFVFPTLYEGFGLPPVEALALGTSVVSSDAASMPEILREQAVYFKSNDKEALKEILTRLSATVDKMPNHLSEYQKRNYSFRSSAEKLLNVLKGAGTDERDAAL